ncbi:InlB B-repeat-containing protein [Butyrivibrio sp. WCD3002]|uniref:InlB B-repeat-containing protein n=1 Tax=Butyrivibrio sp. WCD3002 TaxID=1280676 RepID=UPI00047C1006|nr:InlB B-repeat-containing protein [Butyrivibrio sp. WCD3002]
MDIRRIHLNILLSLLILTGMITAFGISAKAGELVIYGGEGNRVISNSCIVYIPEDIKQKGMLIINGGDVTIDGQGHTITAWYDWVDRQTGYPEEYTKTSILINGNANVTIKNLTIDYSKITDADEAKQVIYANGNVTIENLKIKNAPYRAIRVSDNQTFTTNISNVTIENSEYGIFSRGNVNFSSGKISNIKNAAIEMTKGSFNMTGGTVNNANSRDTMGGIIVKGGTFNMTGGAITAASGGVHLSQSGIMNMTGGSITGCLLKGINYAGGTLNIGGSAVVTDNPSAVAATKINVLVGDGKKINIISALNDDAEIGVTLQNVSDSSLPVPITNGLTSRGNAAAFYADKASKYAVGRRGNEAVLALKENIHTVSFNTDGGSSVPSQKIYTNEKVNEPEKPVKGNYCFAGWFDRYGNKFSFSNGIGEDYTLYAKWETHKHSFTYSASGNAIIATCNNHEFCPFAGNDYKITLRIDPPDIATPGAAGGANAKLIGLKEFNQATGFSVSDNYVTYVGINQTNYPEGFVPPIFAGDYRARVSAGGVTAYVDYSITTGGSGDSSGGNGSGGGTNPGGNSGGNSEAQKNSDGSETITETKMTPEGAMLISVISVDKNGDTVENMIFECLSISEVSLVSYNGKKKKVEVPATIKAKDITYKVVEIGDGVFKNNKKITSMTTGKYLTDVGKNTFKGAKNLKTFFFKGKLTTVDKNAFKNINKKATIKIKAGKKDFNTSKKLIQKSGIAKSVKIKRK